MVVTIIVLIVVGTIGAMILYFLFANHCCIDQVDHSEPVYAQKGKDPTKIIIGTAVLGAAAAAAAAAAAKRRGSNETSSAGFGRMDGGNGSDNWGASRETPDFLESPAPLETPSAPLESPPHYADAVQDTGGGSSTGWGSGGDKAGGGSSSGWGYGGGDKSGGASDPFSGFGSSGNSGSYWGGGGHSAFGHSSSGAFGHSDSGAFGHSDGGGFGHSYSGDYSGGGGGDGGGGD